MLAVSGSARHTGRSRPGASHVPGPGPGGADGSRSGAQRDVRAAVRRARTARPAACAHAQGGRRRGLGPRAAQRRPAGPRARRSSGSPATCASPTAARSRSPGARSSPATAGAASTAAAPATSIDHVVPRSRGGRHEWGNVVSACRRCNHVKADRTVADLGWRLHPPQEPTGTAWRILGTGRSDPAGRPTSRRTAASASPASSLPDGHLRTPGSAPRGVRHTLPAMTEHLPAAGPDPAAAVPSPELDELAAAHGVATDFWDWRGQHVVVPRESIEAVLAALGVPAHTEESVRASLGQARDAPWRRTLPPVRGGRGPAARRMSPVHVPHGEVGAGARRARGRAAASTWRRPTGGSSRARSTAGGSARRPSACPATCRWAGTSCVASVRRRVRRERAGAARRHARPARSCRPRSPTDRPPGG